jgi:hypothetical protein
MYDADETVTEEMKIALLCILSFTLPKRSRIREKPFNGHGIDGRKRATMVSK